VPRALHSRVPNPILVEPRSSEKPLNGQGLTSPDDVWRPRPEIGARPGVTASRNRPERLNTARDAAPPWRAPRRIRKTGTKLVRLLQAAWTIR
jgi:hypothetical protein